MSLSKTKVLVVGAGAAGLSLANLPEQPNIDYLLLEARHGIASTRIYPNGARSTRILRGGRQTFGTTDTCNNRTEDGCILFPSRIAKEIKRRYSHISIEYIYIYLPWASQTWLGYMFHRIYSSFPDSI